MSGLGWDEGQVVHGGARLGIMLSGRVIGEVDLPGGYLELTLDDGSKLLIAADFGASLKLRLTKAQPS